MSNTRYNNLFVGNPIIRLDEVPSTNTFALELLRTSGVSEGTAILARAQTDGRGQRGNTWTSAAGKNITCSIVFRPKFLDARYQFDLTRAVALGVADLLKKMLPQHDVKIKWPNDILVNGKKIAGILIENILSGAQLSASVVGIGLNVNQENFDDDAPNAVSVFQLLQQEKDVDEVLNPLFAALEARYLQLRSGSVEKLRSEYELQLFRKDITARYSDFKNEFDAVLENVTPEGKLRLRSGAGEVKEFGFKEVAFLG